MVQSLRNLSRFCGRGRWMCGLAQLFSRSGIVHLPCDSQEALDWFLKIHQSWQVFTRSAHSINIINPHSLVWYMFHASDYPNTMRKKNNVLCPSASASFWPVDLPHPGDVPVLSAFRRIKVITLQHSTGGMGRLGAIFWCLEICHTSNIWE